MNVNQVVTAEETARSTKAGGTTRGYAALTSKAQLAPFSFERRDPREHDVLIDIQFCGICHSDIHQARDEWGDAIFPMVPGHEITGVVKSVGSKVSKFKVGDRVGVGCFVDSCRTCPECRRGLEQYCAVRTSWTYNGREKDETPTYGGYSEKIVVDENYVLRIPDSLPLGCGRASALRWYHAVLAVEALASRSREESGHRRHGRSRTHGREACSRARRGSHRAEPISTQDRKMENAWARIITTPRPIRRPSPNSSATSISSSTPSLPT